MAKLLGVTIGQILTLLGYDGTAFRNLTVDAAGHLQVDALTTGLAPGAATQVTLAAVLAELLTHTLPTGAATQVTLAAVLAELLTHTLPTGAATQVTLAAVLAELLTHTLPTGAATSGKQDTQTTILAAISSLALALKSVDMDRIMVKGEAQLWNYAGSLANFRQAVISAANGYVESNAPPADEIWCIQRISCKDITTATTNHSLRYNKAGTVAIFDERPGTYAANAVSHGPEIIYLDPGDVIRVVFTDGVAGDQCRVDLLGSIMTLEA